jgi:hypothetical protein
MAKQGEWGNFRNDDGSGRPFGGSSARAVIAETLARRAGWAEIPPAIWADAGAIVIDLRAAGFRLRKD